MAKNQTYDRIRQTELKTIEKYLNRKHDRANKLRDIPILENGTVARQYYELEDATNVVITGIADTHILEWDAATSTWVNVAKPTSGASKKIYSNIADYGNALTGVLNGVNKRFTTGVAYTATALGVQDLEIIFNGIVQTLGVDYTETTPANGTFDFVNQTPNAAGMYNPTGDVIIAKQAN